MATATTIINARVFDGTKPQAWTSVRFTNGVITDCSTTSTAQEGDEVIDANGSTLLPGLIDTHVHLLPGALAKSLNFGVTTVLDMFSKPDQLTTAKHQAASNHHVADVRSSGIGATAPGGHPSLIYAPLPTLTTPDQADSFVADRVAEGSDYLKIIAAPGGLWPSLNSETISALVTAAHASNLLVVAHVNSRAGVDQVVSAGVDVIAHVPATAELDRALVDRIAKAGIAVGPTLVTTENTLGTSQAEANARLLATAGVTLLAGTDAPNPGTVYGESLHRELELLVRCGLSPAQALSAATAEPARVFGLPDRGQIAPGNQADLLLVTGDPLTDITATRTIERIWRAGTPHKGRDFVPTKAEAEQLEAFDTQVAKAVAAVRKAMARPQASPATAKPSSP